MIDAQAHQNLQITNAIEQLVIQETLNKCYKLLCYGVFHANAVQKDSGYFLPKKELPVEKHPLMKKTSLYNED